MTLRSLLDVPAPAKVNLFLHVVGRRSDGFHLLRSLFVLIDWADTLHFERREDGRLQRHDLCAELPEDDLCLRAARSLQRASGTSLGADVSIVKRVPAGAGLGGGSSDAASTLIALNRLWQLNWPRARLAELALPLGADVPFFVGGSHALVEGIGERLSPAAVPPQVLAIVKPAASIATRDIFAGLGLAVPTDDHGRAAAGAVASGAAAILTGSLADAEQALAGPGSCRNDLQPVAERLCREVALAARWLHERYGNSQMTGSGSAVFARVGTGSLPMATLPVAELPPGWAGRLCRSLDRHPLAGWSD